MSAAKHNMSAQIISRSPNVWRVKCGRHDEWTGPTYEAVEDEWRRHVHAETGKAPEPCGDKDGRWTP
jgi:hypothetical protein